MKSEGFTQRKVAKLLQIHRTTVKKYWDMTPDEFQERILEPAKKSRLEQHKELILSWLRAYPAITAAVRVINAPIAACYLMLNEFMTWSKISSDAAYNSSVV